MQLVDQFERSAVAAAATVERLPRSADQIAGAVLRASPGARRIAIEEPQDLPAESFAACRRLPGVFAGRTTTSAHA